MANKVFKACLILIVTVSSGAALHAAVQDAREETTALLQKTRAVSDITQAGDPPFRLHARFQGTEPGKHNSLEGTLELSWNSDSQWRLEITTPSYRESQGGDNETVWITRSLKYRPEIIGQFVGAFTLIRHAAAAPEESVVERKGTSPNGRPLRCLEIAPKKGVKRALCLDRADGTLVYEHIFDVAEVSYELSNYALAGDKRFFRRISIYHGEKVVLEAEVDALELSPTTHVTVFEPAAGAKSQPGCFAPEPPKVLRSVNPAYPPLSRMRGEQGIVSVYAEIGTDGRSHNKAILRSVSPELNALTLGAIDRWQFEPARCHGLPVPYETSIDVAFTLDAR